MAIRAMRRPRWRSGARSRTVGCFAVGTGDDDNEGDSVREDADAFGSAIES